MAISDLATTAATAAFQQTAGGFSGLAKNKSGKGSIQQIALNAHLQSLGATKEEIKGINDSINRLVKISQVKQENMGDKIALLKRIEIKFNDMVELRKVFKWFDPDGLSSQEHRIKI